MITLGDKIRDAIVEKMGKKGEKKVAVMKRAAGLLGMSVSNLYANLNKENIDVDLLEKIQRIIGIDIEKLRSYSSIEGIDAENAKLKHYTFPVKNGEAQIFLPQNSDKDDVKTLIQYLTLFEKSLS